MWSLDVIFVIYCILYLVTITYTRNLCNIAVVFVILALVIAAISVIFYGSDVIFAIFIKSTYLILKIKVVIPVIVTSFSPIVSLPPRPSLIQAIWYRMSLKKKNNYFQGCMYINFQDCLKTISDTNWLVKRQIVSKCWKHNF